MYTHVESIYTLLIYGYFTVCIISPRYLKGRRVLSVTYEVDIITKSEEDFLIYL